MKVLLLENVHPVAAETFRRNGFEVEVQAGSLSESDLVEALSGVSVLGIRSNTKVTQAVLDAAPDLRAIGCFCIGTNQVDLTHATKLGVGVFNAPFSNTRSVVELVIGEILALARRLPEKTQRMHDGIWDKSAKGAYETRGRTLGIVGYGNIGTQLSNMAEAIGLRVAFYDTADRLAHGNAQRMGSLDELLEASDFVSIHVDGRPGNAGLFGAEQFSRMKPGSVFINASRGMVVDDVALREHILSGHLSGAAIDVFPVEPKAQGDLFESPLRGLDNVILTPHVGGSTGEAQEEIGTFVSGKLSAYMADGATALSVNLPTVAPAPREGSFRMALLHRNVPGVLASINRTLAEAGANVVGQSLATRGELGYVITDTDVPMSAETLESLRHVAEAVHLETWPEDAPR
ncbi:phosphoglycerate dehydrogenase [Terrabacter terrigena]|uniref:D-3-phosphoglycerate dehydrogenase n=1 Tax=Terrabacter terrigena TaxID=574718 RepID=A0ABW3N2X1_9MICO